MLELVNIKKDYLVSGGAVPALKGITLNFRENEFVSILGPSGCGKTTLLNIIGGLDHYTSGDLIISNKSTKEFNDRDWDTYRNHKIGFIFQSYNLIPHQTVLENVELALTIAGITKQERIKLSKQALEKVGLIKEINKKPNQLSGGQCQRVAIARALVNQPDILLADEPTGALDTQTSVQIMDLIKEISKEKLVIMVTHNPELAEKYSSRIIKLLDGEVIKDSNPYLLEDNNVLKNSEEEKVKTQNNKQKNKKSKLSFWQAFKLSARNLKSKLKRTLLVCLAGSIGIIGVASVLAVSNGVQTYIHSIQNDMLSGNPIKISENAVDLSALMSSSSTFTKTNALKKSVKDGKINVDYVLESLISSNNGISNFRVQNTITQDYLDFLNAMPKEYYSSIATYYGIDVTNNVYTDIDLTDIGTKNMSLTAIRNLYSAIIDKTDQSAYSTYVTSLISSLEEAPQNKEFVLSQYDIISGENSHYPEKVNEIMLVVDKDTQLTDLLLGSLGYFSQDEFVNVIYRATDNENYNSELDIENFDYSTLLNKSFRYYKNDTIYSENTNSLSKQAQPFFYSGYEDENWQEGLELKVTAILRQKEDYSYGCLTSGCYFTSELTKKFILDNINSQIVNNLKDNNNESYTSMNYTYNNVSIDMGLTYNFSYNFQNTIYNETGFVGKTNMFSSMSGLMGGGSAPKSYTLTLRELGGLDLPNNIEIYPVDFKLKDNVTSYLDIWNSDEEIVVNNATITKDNREKVTYTDNLSIIINLVNNLINIVTYALVAFTALSLVVSTVMISIITYVSVIERIKEIGIIRALGGRKKDVSMLFNAETFIIGASSGIIGILVTYILSAIINLIIGGATGIFTIASLPVTAAIIMILISIILTAISGLIPAKLASKKDPVVALRTE